MAAGGVTIGVDVTRVGGRKAADAVLAEGGLMGGRRVGRVDDIPAVPKHKTSCKYPVKQKENVASVTHVLQSRRPAFHKKIGVPSLHSHLLGPTHQ